MSDSRLSSTAEATRESLRSRHDLRSTGSTSGPAVLIRMATWICCDLLNRTAAATRAAASRDSEGKVGIQPFQQETESLVRQRPFGQPFQGATRNGAGCWESSIIFLKRRINQPTRCQRTHGPFANGQVVVTQRRHQHLPPSVR
ncbi:MAG: hypothetical protein Ct9H300mP1_23620 [Planctomycetaceae bacterium]|nr:MAG: hypothetical protein Ct9H300mP1_23620 [Planctomycetaceae bacterium]